MVEKTVAAVAEKPPLARMEKLTAVKGMNDILPPESGRWEWFEAKVRALMARYAYANVRTPIVEPTALFVRGLGEVTDIVEKEMYSFVDSMNGDKLTLRPEATAGIVRAMVEHNALYNGPMRVWSAVPLFRHERPQKGRYRQFHQIDVEALGFAGPDVDAEQILMCRALLHDLGIPMEHVRLELNSLGQPSERMAHRAALIAHFEVNAVRAVLDAVGVAYRINPRLVRGMDYYNLTVFEWITDKLGSQGTVCGGGRYDGLFEQLGGKPTPAVGWGMGVERMLLLLEAVGVMPPAGAPDVYAVVPSPQEMPAAMVACEALRAVGVNVQMHAGTGEGMGSMKSQFKKADASGARYALIFGETELAQGCVAVKPLRGEKEQAQQAQVLQPLSDVAAWAHTLHG
ncbi:MAG: histidine--tRNA ligase [Polaromonas sp.]|nr:histidine--tRNA ligase [Polaromonas sp.]